MYRRPSSLSSFPALPVAPVEVNVYQSLNPGNISRIELLTTDQQTTAFPIGDVGASLICPRVLNLTIATGAATNLVPFYMWDARGADTVAGIGQALTFAHTPMIYGESVTGGLALAAGQSHAFQDWVFMGQFGDVVNITRTATAPTLDAYVQLLDSGGNVVAFGDDNGDSLNASIAEFALPGSGLYTIRASGFGGSIGPFSLELNGIPAPPPQ
ncbi:MAG TPA: hypothetical protein VHO69_07730 [Phototrophicaceae bacterium]|nr:hypothetical protein [Phototrophicaceae bacterium]